MNTNIKHFASRLTLLCGCFMLLIACASTHQTRKAMDSSGFLGDYSQLGPGKSGEALKLYISPSANFKSYTKILMDPVKIYAVKGGDLEKISKDDRQRLVDYFHAAVHEKLKGDYTFVDQPGPGVMRLRLGITEAQGAHVVLDTISTILPIGLAISGVKRLAVGTPTSVGQAAAEAELVDSQTGARLMAAMDSRFGEKITLKIDKFDKWRAVTDSFDYWALRLQTRLTELRTQPAQ